MGVRLMVEVFDHWSDFGLTSGERSDLLVIAENANDKTRETFGSIHAPYILHRAGDKSPAAWKNTIGKLMKKGALDYALKNGKPVVGYRGQAAVYRVPHLCPLRNHDGLWGECRRDDEWVTSQVTHSKEEGHPSGDPLDGEGHPSDDPNEEKGSPEGWERVTSQVTPTPPSPPTTSADAEAGNEDDGLFPEPGTKPGPKKTKKKPSKPKTPPPLELIQAKELTRAFWQRYSHHYTCKEVAVRRIVQTSLENGVERNALAFALDALGKGRTPVTQNTLGFALKKVYETHGQTGAPSMASQRTATRCSEHALPLPCSSCRGDIRAGDDEVPRRLLAEYGPEVRWDLAEQFNHKGEAA